MAYVFTGTKRSLKFTVTKSVGGITSVGYPKTYNGQVSWGNVLYPTLTDTAFAQLTTAQYNARYAAFKLYVESLEPGFDLSADATNAPTVADAITCPPPATTTTTTEATTTTTT